jgi:acrylyl-CoA reductase (NADPH)
MDTLPPEFVCYRVVKDADGRAHGQVESRPVAELPPGEVVVRVRYSSLNYKDALSATGNEGITKHYPHVPGIDAAGVILATESSKWRVGDEVIVTGFHLGSNHWGGFSELIRVPADWLVPLPAGLTLRESMIIGTAGFTAALSVKALHHAGVLQTSGDVVVTGATGGVGSIAVALLAKLGYSVTAVTGKSAMIDWLQKLGTTHVAGRTEVDDTSNKPLLSGRWAGAIDTVGGNTLATIIRSLAPNGCAAACGLVGGASLPLSVYPFLLRGVSLIGIDSAWRSHDERVTIWNQLATTWKLDCLDTIAHQIELSEINRWIGEILAGRVTGRVVVRLPH